jgi:hypothetical protein
MSGVWRLADAVGPSSDAMRAGAREVVSPKVERDGSARDEVAVIE